MLGGLIMCHGDDFGLVLPPVLAPVQAVVVVVKETDGAVTRAASALVDELNANGIRTRLDDNVSQGFGWRATEWDLQGVPIRVEIGPRDVADERGAALPQGYPGEVRRGTRQRRRRGAAAGSSDSGRDAGGGDGTPGRSHLRLRHTR